jgi:small subunit ribosomal protein S16
MAVRIKLKRYGRKHQPHYRLTAVDHRKDRNADVIEELGLYDPINRKEDQQVILKRERIEYWLGVGAQPTDTVRRIFERNGLVQPKAQTQPGAPKAAPVKAGVTRGR